jgi:hypothetical protein
VSTEEFLGDANGNLRALKIVETKFVNGKLESVPGTEKEIPADFAFLAMGFTGPEKNALIDQLDVALDSRGNIARDENYATNIDGVFILRETNLRNRRALWENYAGVIPTFSLFCTIMDNITNDYTALYVHNANSSNSLEDCLFWYKSKPVPDDFKFGSKEIWKYHFHRYNEEYTEPYI